MAPTASLSVGETTELGPLNSLVSEMPATLLKNSHCRGGSQGGKKNPHCKDGKTEGGRAERDQGKLVYMVAHGILLLGWFNLKHQCSDTGCMT